MVIDLSKPVLVYFTDDDLDDYELFVEAAPQISENIELVLFLNCELLLQLLKEGIPDILFIDIHLGKTTGIECLQVIKSTPQSSRVPTIVMSTSASKTQIDECLKLGGNYYLEKPSSYEEVVEEMKKIFKTDWQY